VAFTHSPHILHTSEAAMPIEAKADSANWIRWRCNFIVANPQQRHLFFYDLFFIQRCFPFENPHYSAQIFIQPTRSLCAIFLRHAEKQPARVSIADIFQINNVS
jgi:hypothetical protein